MKREHNKENLVMIATHEGILSAVYCCLPLSSRVQAHDRQVGISTSADFQNHQREPYL
jgi:hypothetical protein